MLEISISGHVSIYKIYHKDSDTADLNMSLPNVSKS